MEEHGAWPELPERIESLLEQAATLSTLNKLLAGTVDHGPVLIEQMYGIGVSCKNLAIDAAIFAVQEGAISWRGAADRLHMHPHTLQAITNRRKVSIENPPQTDDQET